MVIRWILSLLDIITSRSPVEFAKCDPFIECNRLSWNFCAGGGIPAEDADTRSYPIRDSLLFSMFRPFTRLFVLFKWTPFLKITRFFCRSQRRCSTVNGKSTNLTIQDIGKLTKQIWFTKRFV